MPVSARSSLDRKRLVRVAAAAGVAAAALLVAGSLFWQPPWRRDDRSPAAAIGRETNAGVVDGILDSARGAETAARADAGPERGPSDPAGDRERAEAERELAEIRRRQEAERRRLGQPPGPEGQRLSERFQQACDRLFEAGSRHGT